LFDLPNDMFDIWNEGATQAESERGGAASWRRAVNEALAIFRPLPAPPTFWNDFLR
jgi:hypothetical protein